MYAARTVSPDADLPRASLRRQAVVLCGGLATRLLPRTERVPKFLLPVAGRPFAGWLLERLAACAYDEVVLCVGHLGDAIEDAVGDGLAFGVPVRYSREGPRLLGTAGALRAAVDILDATFLVTYGDSYLPFDYRMPLDDLRAHPDDLGTMSVFENHDRWDASNTAIRGDHVLRYDKRVAGATPDGELAFIDYGALALARSVVAELPPATPLGLDAIQTRLAAEGRLRALVAERRFFEIGSEEGLAELEAELGRAAPGARS